MTKEEKLTGAVKRVAWGYLFLTLNFNLGRLNILPGWLGYALILAALPALAEEGRPFRLLRPLAIGLAAWDAAVWALALLGVTGEMLGSTGSIGASLVSFANLLVGVVSLYFHFQLLTDLAAVAENRGCPQAKRLLTLRTVRTLLAAAALLPLPWQSAEWLGLLLALAAVAVVAWLCVLLFSFCGSLKKKGGEDPEERGEEPPSGM
ncbi:MAG: hypothetical protein ACI4PC_08295 [Oscillospiraceae bacterium]